MSKKFMLVYRDDVSAMSAAPSPQEMQDLMARWGAWIEKFMKAGVMVDPGDALNPSGKVLKKSGVVTDGPFVEAKEVLGGYSIIQVASFDKALDVAKECPAHKDGSSIEIRELAGLSAQ